MTQRVSVLSANGTPLMPCHPARARALLRGGKATVKRRQPFVIQLTERDSGGVQPVTLKVDPGSKITGIALVADFQQGPTVIQAAEIEHRSRQISKRLADRRALRRGRRSRKTRYRAPRFDNRRRPEGWLPPSLWHRVESTMSQIRRLQARVPVHRFEIETTRFDVHSLSAGRSLSGVEYQHGTLHGTEVREYLLHRHSHTCAYCKGLSGDPVLEVEHVIPRSRGGSNRISNLVISDRTCNTEKGNRTASEWAQSLSGQRSKLSTTRATNAQKVANGLRPSLRDAAAMNATRYALGREIKALGLPVSFASGGRTKFNRTSQGYPKAHWIDAACVGASGEKVTLHPGDPILRIKCTGRGKHQVQRTDRFGFPTGKAGRVKRVHGFQTGDYVRLRQPRGKYAGVYLGALASIRSSGTMDIVADVGKISANHKNYSLVQRSDGYRYEVA
jgi:5-methylcytosine-specific restriction endonuclease McrA